MPIAECGFANFGPIGSAYLEAVGPTIQVDIGFHPSIFAPAPPSPVPGVPVSPSAGTNPTPVPLPAMPIIPSGVSRQSVPALIDTGANMSCIDETLAQSLQLPLINQINSGGVHGQGLLNVYLAFVEIPLLNTMQFGMFIGAIMTSPGQIHRALLGRTLLKEMILVYDGKTGSVKLAI